MTLLDFLTEAAHSGASDLFLVTGAPVSVKVEGVLRPLEEEDDRALLLGAVDRLSPRERRIIEMRYGLRGQREKTQKEVADVMGISQSYISRLEKRIMLRLRREILKQTSCA